jgi:YVTN family beta-propeller protein
MKRKIFLLIAFCYWRLFASFFCIMFSATAAAQQAAQQPRFHALVFYTTKTEPDHVQFSDGAIAFFKALAAKDNFTFEATTNWDDLNTANLSKCQLVLWLNDFPNKEPQRRAFETYMANGGAWLGFHVAAYNDADTHWPWFIDFLGGGVFNTNSWPPLPAKLIVDDRAHPATQNLSEGFLSPANEWYIWKPSPRLNKDVRVLVSLDASNYPLGLKDTLLSGDLPVVWSDTKYKMIYMNMGHGDKIFTSPVQNQLFEDAFMWLGTGAKSAGPVTPSTTAAKQAESAEASGTLLSPRGVAVNSKTGNAYSVNSGSDTVTITDSAHHSIASVKVGKEPVAIAVNPETNRIYVANSGSGTVSVIDGASDAVTATVLVGELPYVLAVNPTTDKIYVSRTYNNDMTVIDGATNATSKIKSIGQADAIAVNPASKKIYLVSYEGNTVTVIDGANDQFKKVEVGTHLWGVAVNSTTNKIYFTDQQKSSLAVLDGSTNTVASASAGDMPSAVAVDESANKIYVANYASDTVTVIDGARNQAIATLKVGSHPQALAVNTQTHKIFVANAHSDDVTVIDGATSTVAATVNTAHAPYAIAVDSSRNRIYVNSVGGNHLTVIDGSTQQVIP